MDTRFRDNSNLPSSITNPKRIHSGILVLLLALFITPAWASRSQPELLSQRVASADFIGIVVAEAAEEIEIDGFQIHAWRFRVETSLKGEVPLALGVDGGGWVKEATCCEAGGRYLLFAEKGYRVFDRDRLADAAPIGAQEIASPVNGNFGALKIVDGRVDWPATIGTQPDTDGRLAIGVALDLVRREIATSLPSGAVLDGIESEVTLPVGAHRLQDYTRIYAADGAAGTIVGFYYRDVDRRERRRIWEMPRVFDGGCDYVRFEYALTERQFHWIACNEGESAPDSPD